MTREQIIKNLEYLIQFLPSKSIYAGETLTRAIDALREKQQRERGCEWCNGAWETSDMDYITGVSEWDIDSMDFCPRCGRYLARAGRWKDDTGRSD